MTYFLNVHTRIWVYVPKLLWFRVFGYQYQVSSTILFDLRQCQCQLRNELGFG